MNSQEIVKVQLRTSADICSGENGANCSHTDGMRIKGKKTRKGNKQTATRKPCSEMEINTN